MRAIVMRHEFAEPLQEMPLVGIEPGWNFHMNQHVQIAAAAALQPGHAFAAQGRQLGAGLDAGGNFDFFRAPGSGNFKFAA